MARTSLEIPLNQHSYSVSAVTGMDYEHPLPRKQITNVIESLEC